MSYQVSRSQKISEVLELVRPDGTVAESLAVEIDIEKIARQYRQKELEILKAQQLVQKGSTEESLDVLGQAVKSLFGLVFGEGNTQKLLDFYEHNYTEMALEISPFIADVIAPAIQKSVEEKKQQVEERYKIKNKKRLIGR